MMMTSFHFQKNVAVFMNEKLKTRALLISEFQSEKGNFKLYVSVADSDWLVDGGGIISSWCNVIVFGWDLCILYLIIQ
jgi:hypothetical protein